jgi:hypothetical protein
MNMMETRFKSFEGSTASQCRWSEYAAELIGDWDLIYDGSSADYQGTVEVLAYKEGRFAYLTYSYGSCSGCDGWEDLGEDKVREDFANLIEYFEDVHELKAFTERVKFGAEFEHAVREYMFHAELEKVLEN